MTNSLNIVELITNASLLVQIIMVILLLASVIAWGLIFRLSARMSSATNTDNHFLEWFWAGENLNNLFAGIKTLQNKQGLESVFYNGFNELLQTNQQNKNRIQIIEKKLGVVLGNQQQDLESGLATLASIGAVSPYIGLLGTVWGIINAFIGLSDVGQSSLSAVAPGIAEALIATAMGLFAAIPAVLAYNHFTAKANRIYEQRALFCDELTGLLQRDYTSDANIIDANNHSLNDFNNNNVNVSSQVSSAEA